jgi:hypothetical protein
MLAEPLAVAMRTAHALDFRQKLVTEIGSPKMPFATTTMPRFFANDFVHI